MHHRKNRRRRINVSVDRFPYIDHTKIVRGVEYKLQPVFEAVEYKHTLVGYKWQKAGVASLPSFNQQK